MRKFPSIEEYMDTVVPTLSPGDDIRAAVAFLLEHRVTGAPVVDESGALCGIVTEFDCLRVLTEGDASSDRPTGTVGDFMTRDAVTVDPSVDIYYAAGVFLRNRFRRLPVVRDGRVVGAITRFDILRAVDTLL